VIGASRANGSAIRRLVAINDLVHRQPEYRSEWIVLEYGIAVEVDG
jgi:hypothetical protein